MIFCSLFSIFAIKGKLVIQSEDVNTVKAADIEKDATLVNKFERDTDCEGVTVVFLVN